MMAVLNVCGVCFLIFYLWLLMNEWCFPVFAFRCTFHVVTRCHIVSVILTCAVIFVIVVANAIVIVSFICRRNLVYLWRYVCRSPIDRAPALKVLDPHFHLVHSHISRGK